MDGQMIIPFSLLDLKKTLGKGHYGEVKLASWKRGGGQLPLNIAAKVFNVKQVRFFIYYLTVLEIMILKRIYLIPCRRLASYTLASRTGKTSHMILITVYAPLIHALCP
jgi:hypothetical protein